MSVSTHNLYFKPPRFDGAFTSISEDLQLQQKETTMNKDKIKQMRMIAGYVEDLLDNVPASELRTIKDAVHSLHKVADYYDDPVKLVRERFQNPNIKARIDGVDLVFKPDFSHFRWHIESIRDFIRGYDWIEPESNAEVICICDIDLEEIVIDFETKEIRIDADYYVSLL